MYLFIQCKLLFRKMYQAYFIVSAWESVTSIIRNLTKERYDVYRCISREALKENINSKSIWQECVFIQCWHECSNPNWSSCVVKCMLYTGCIEKHTVIFVVNHSMIYCIFWEAPKVISIGIPLLSTYWCCTTYCQLETTKIGLLSKAILAYKNMARLVVPLGEPFACFG